MKRAVELFDFEKRPSASSLLTGTWQTQSDDLVESFLSVAVTQWEIVVTRQEAETWVTLRGPETRASTAPVPTDAEFFGVTFSLGTFMPSLDMQRLADRELTLPLASKTSFWLEGSAWEIPTPDNADVFVDRLVGAGLLVHDPVAAAALLDDEGSEVAGLSTRTVERRVARATGLTRGTIRQIRRAERAVELLGRGMPALEVARRAGYADQPHLTRSLKRFVGQTPSQITVTP
jgi:AraC-like DNA-binding protein